LNFDPAALTDQQKEVVANRERAIVVGRYESQTHGSSPKFTPLGQAGKQVISMQKDHRATPAADTPAISVQRFV
jgi:hypothetical protein